MEYSVKNIEGVDVQVAFGFHPDDINWSEVEKLKGKFQGPYLRPEPSGLSEATKIAWVSSRQCLDAAFVRSGLQLGDCVLSVSHGRRASVGCVASRSDMISIGVDIEESGRSVSDSVLERFQSHSEESKLLSRIQLWCVKEACYKADFGKGKVVKNYQVVSFDNHSGTGVVEGPAGPIKFLLFQLHRHEIVIALKKEF